MELVDIHCTSKDQVIEKNDRELHLSFAFKRPHEDILSKQVKVNCLPFMIMESVAHIQVSGVN